MGKLRVIGQSVLYLLVFFGIMMGATLGGSVLILVYGILFLHVPPEQVEQYLNSMLYNGNITMILTLFMYLILLVGFGLWYWFYCRKKENVVSGMTAMTPGNVLLVTVIGILLQILTQPVMVGVEHFLPEVFKEYLELIESVKMGETNLFLIVICIVLIGPLTEELFFRGILYRTLRKEMSFIVAAVISSLVFGIYHMNLVQGIYCSLVGFVLCYVYEKTKSFLVTSVLHIVFNGSSYVLDYFLQSLTEQQTNMLEAFDLIILAVCLGIFFFAIFKLKSYREVSNENV